VYVNQLVESWRDSVPITLLTAVYAVRDVFVEDERMICQATIQPCYELLHEDRLPDCIPSLQKYAEDEDAWRELVWRLRKQDPEDVFAASFELYVQGMATLAGRAFNDLLRMAQAHGIEGPVAWAQEQAMYLARANAERVRSWINRSLLWEILVLADPAWNNVDERVAAFVEHLDSKIKSEANKAHIELASQAPVLPPSLPPHRARKASATTQRQRIILEAINNGLKGLNYFKQLDECKARIPNDWKRQGCPSSHVAAYRDPQWRQRLQEEKSRTGRKTSGNHLPHLTDK